jgi:hypothetical protein
MQTKDESFQKKNEENSADYLKEAFSLLDSDTEEEDGQFEEVKEAIVHLNKRLDRIEQLLTKIVEKLAKRK